VAQLCERLCTTNIVSTASGTRPRLRNRTRFSTISTPAEILGGRLSGVDLIVLGQAIVIPIAYTIWVFSRRDLPAPD